MATFSHPSNSQYTESVDAFSVLWTALFGFFYLMYVRAWFAAFLTVIIGAPLVGTVAFMSIAAGSLAIVALTYVSGCTAWALAMLPLIERSYLRRGWRPANMV